MKTMTVWVAVLIAPLFFVSCNNDTNTTSNGNASDGGNTEDDTQLQTLHMKSDQKAGEVDPELLSGNAEFAIKTFKALLADEEGKNIFISPVSISIALSMTMNGAVGETFDGMQSALEFSAMTQEEINAAFLTLLESLEYSDENVLLNFANSIWLDPGYRPNIKQLFIDDVEKWYLSEVHEAKSPEQINTWVEEKTNGKIKEMIDQFPADLVMYLINAIYFKGAWTTTFDKEDSYETTFTKSDKTTVDINMMAFTDVKDYNSYIDKDIVAVRLPYGRGKIAFYAFAPQEYGEGSIDDFIENLDGASLDSIFSSFKEEELGGIHLPKFKIEYEKNLNEILKAFGMEKAYLGGFDNMVSDTSAGLNPYISNVKHKAFIEVNEEGTEAAAATTVEMVDESMPTTFRANRPFFFIIRDDRNGTILFMGKLACPS